MKEECEYFKRCIAPLCPLEKDIKKHIWYPDEPICSLKKFQNLDWIKKQKQLKNKANPNFYFTIDTLLTTEVRKRVKGLDPDA